MAIKFSYAADSASAPFTMRLPTMRLVNAQKNGECNRDDDDLSQQHSNLDQRLVNLPLPYSYTN